MKYIYFNVSNGEIIEPGPLPAYRALLDWKLKVVAFDVCFSKDSINRNGEEWAKEQLAKEKREWDNYKWLKKGLRRFKWKMWGKRQVIALPDWFVYLQAW